MRKNFKDIDIYAGIQPQNGAEWQAANGIDYNWKTPEHIEVKPVYTKEDLEKLAYYVLTYSKVVYVYNEGYRTKFTGAVEGLMKYGKTLGNYTDLQIEMAAYETLLEANMKRPASSFANLPWSKDLEHPGIKFLIDEYEWQLRRVKV